MFKELEGNFTTSIDEVSPRGRKRDPSAISCERQQEMLEALQETSGSLAVETDIKLILSRIAQTLLKALDAKYVNFWDFTPDKKAAHIIAAHGMQPGYLEHSRKDPIPLGAAWVGRAMKTGKAWATSDVQRDPLLPPSWLPVAKKQAYHGLLCMPLTRKDEIVGGMCIYYKDVHKFGHFEMSLTSIVANQAATAVANANLFKELLGERNKTLATIQSLKDGLIMYDLDEKIVIFNPRAQELLWLKEKDILNKKIDEKMGQGSVYLKNLYNIKNLSLSDFETKEYATEGPQKVILEVTYVPVRAKYQKIGAMQILRDITKDKELELLKSSFVSIASHQMRTPLSAIKWSLDSLRRGDVGDLSPEQKSLVERTFNANEQSINLVRDLLDVSRIEEGKFGYDFTEGDIATLIEKICDEFKPQAEAKKISLVFEKQKNLPGVFFDESKLGIAIRNVFDNAIKYTSPGGHIEVDLRPSVSNKFMVLSVEDNGIGIPEKDQKFIFAKFFRARNAIKYETEGSGLGLYIAKKIAEKHNANLFFESEENKGSEFVFQFPLESSMIPKGVVPFKI